MEEIWKEVYHEGEYVGKKISNFGRLVCDNGYVCIAADNGAGYLSYAIKHVKQTTKYHKPIRRYIHRLVAEAFIPNPDNLPQVNHIDGDKSNNVVTNLEWISNSANILHAHAIGRMKKRTEEKTSVVHLTVEQVIDCYVSVKAFGEGVGEVARRMGKSRTTISSILNKRSRGSITDKLDIMILCSNFKNLEEYIKAYNDHYNT